MSNSRETCADALRSLFDDHVVPPVAIEPPGWPGLAREVGVRRLRRRLGGGLAVVVLLVAVAVTRPVEPSFSAMAFAPRVEAFPPVTAEFETLARFVTAVDDEDGAP